MRLRAFETTGVAGVRDGTFTFVTGEGGGRVAVVVGPPGSGKSRLLRAIAAHKEAVAAYGSTGWIPSIARGHGSPCRTRAEWALTDAEKRFGAFPGPTSLSEVGVDHGHADAEADPGMVALFDRYEVVGALGRLFWIPPHRLPVPRSSGSSEPLLEERMLAATDDPAKLANALMVVRKALRSGDGGPRVERAKALVEQLDAGVRIAGMGMDGELEVHLRGDARVGFSRLATSQQQAVALACYVAVTDPRESVILLDSPEAGLPPGTAARWVEALAAHEPTNQWIVATSDPAVAQVQGATVVEMVQSIPGGA